MFFIPDDQLNEISVNVEILEQSLQILECCKLTIVDRINSAIDYMSEDNELYPTDEKYNNDLSSNSIYTFRLNTIDKEFEVPDLKLIRSGQYNIDLWVSVFEELKYNTCTTADIQAMIEKTESAMVLVTNINTLNQLDCSLKKYILQKMGHLYMDYHFWIEWKITNHFESSIQSVEKMIQELDSLFQKELLVENDIKIEQPDRWRPQVSSFDALFAPHAFNFSYEDKSQFEAIMIEASVQFSEEMVHVDKKLKVLDENLSKYEAMIQEIGYDMVKNEKQNIETKKLQVEQIICNAYGFYKYCMSFVE
eukprot:550659_1